jgi:hypothetical protein
VLIAVLTPPDKRLAVRNRKKKPTTKALPVVDLIVRRGALRRFDKLKKETVDLPVNLLWDRRLHERRKSQNDVERDQRRQERRKDPPFTWDVADFVVVEAPRRMTHTTE